MKKILIVDDNENNRMLLRALLEDYAEDNNDVFNIKEAVNGLEASLAAENTHFDLIFMDIMMPQMDGVEATRRIRACDTKVMIVTVSAVDDGERQRQILRNGAEDYISKPINADIFTARLINYFSLIESRNHPHIHTHKSICNLFSKDVYARQFNFIISNEDELSEFWEYYLLDSSKHSVELSDTIHTIYSIASTGLKIGASMQIIVEESDDNMYVTLTGIQSINAKIIKLIMVKNPSVTDYTSDTEKFCIRLSNPKKYESPEIGVKESIAPVAVYTEIQEAIHVYDYMDQEDLADLKEYVGKLNSLMLVVGGEIEHHEVNKISYNLQQISRIATGYTDSYPIGSVLADMGRIITDHADIFIAKSYDIAPMCTAFGRDLSSWIQLIFVEGATNVHYMDDTIIANAQLIQSILTMNDEDHHTEVENLDDIFDF